MKFQNKTKEANNKKLQGAMEYLMTYGWAILIIAVVMAVLFALGVFNPLAFAPKAPPGSCQIQRPFGPGTTQQINTQGLCNGQIPQYVARFNGRTGNYITGNFVTALSGNQITITAWINPNANVSGLNYLGVLYVGSGGCTSAESLAIFTTLQLDACGRGFNSGIGVATNKWSFVAYSLKGASITMYVNSQQQSGALSSSQSINPNSFYIGIDLEGSYPPLNGSIANVQLYNTSLSSNVIQAIYQEGIGGAPITLQNLLSWWPLNGDALDYSGNNNNGVQLGPGITFSSGWYYTYSH